MPKMIGSFRFGRDILRNGKTKKAHRRGAEGEGYGELSRYRPWCSDCDSYPLGGFNRHRSTRKKSLLFHTGETQSLLETLQGVNGIQIESLADSIQLQFITAVVFLETRVFYASIISRFGPGKWTWGQWARVTAPKPQKRPGNAQNGRNCLALSKAAFPGICRRRRSPEK